MTVGPTGIGVYNPTMAPMGRAGKKGKVGKGPNNGSVRNARGTASKAVKSVVGSGAGRRSEINAMPTTTRGSMSAAQKSVNRGKAGVRGGVSGMRNPQAPARNKANAAPRTSPSTANRAKGTPRGASASRMGRAGRMY
jgi:hypothetical protein